MDPNLEKKQNQEDRKHPLGGQWAFKRMGGRIAVQAGRSFFTFLLTSPGGLVVLLIVFIAVFTFILVFSLGPGAIGDTNTVYPPPTLVEP